MRYLLLIHQEEGGWDKLPKHEQRQGLAEWQAFGESIKQSGHYVASSGLAPSGTATIVRVRNGKLSTTDGPFAETKEQLGGFFFIEAKDLNDAIQVASRIPSARWGSIEVRPAWQANDR